MTFIQQLRIVKKRRNTVARYAQDINDGDIITLKTNVDIWGETITDRILRIDIYRDGEFLSDILQYEIKYFKEIFEYEELL